MSNSSIATFLQNLTIAAGKLKPEDIDAVLNRTAYIDLKIISLNEVQAISKKENTIDFSEIDDILDNADTREVAIQFLSKSSKSDLLKYSKLLSIASDSSMNKEKLVERIVERKVGLRLRQNAFSEVMRTA